MNSGSTPVDEMIGKLETILSMVNDWLKFAEAKNAILLGFSGAGITATTTYLSTASNVAKPIGFCIILVTFLLCVCSFICSLSFLPKTNLEVLVWKKQKPGRKSKGIPTDEDNLHFYGHLYKYNKNELIDALNRLYFENYIQNINKKEYADLANQIVVNSEITYLKFQFFKWASYLLIAALFCVLICILTSLFFYKSYVF